MCKCIWSLSFTFSKPRRNLSVPVQLCLGSISSSHRRWMVNGILERISRRVLIRAVENERFRPAGGVGRRQLLVGHLPDKLTDRWNMSDCRLINVTDDNDFTKIIINHSFPVLSQINVCYANRLKKKIVSTLVNNYLVITNIYIYKYTCMFALYVWIQLCSPIVAIHYFQDPRLHLFKGNKLYVGVVRSSLLWC